MLGQIHSNALWGPHPSATLSCSRLAGIGPSAQHLPFLSRSVACQRSHRTNANSARHASAGGIRRQVMKHCEPTRRGAGRDSWAADVLESQRIKQQSCTSVVGRDSHRKHLCRHRCGTPVAQGKSGTDLEVAPGPLPVWDACLEGASRG